MYDKETVLIVVDMQNDFADPRGGLYVKNGGTLVPFINEQIRAASEAKAKIAYSRDWHPPVTPHFAKDGGLWPTHCVQDTWGSAYHPGLLQPRVRDFEALKGKEDKDGFSAFEGTGLAGWLNAKDVKKVVILGLAIDYCVKATALSAVDLGFDTTVILKGTLAVDLEEHDGDKAVFEMVQAGVCFV